MKNLLRGVTLLAATLVIAGCSKSEPLDVTNDPPKGAVAAPMNSTAAPTQSKPQGAKAETQ